MCDLVGVISNIIALLGFFFFFFSVNADFIQYCLSCTVLLRDKLPLLVLYCITGSSLSHLYTVSTQSAGNNFTVFYKWSPNLCLDSMLDFSQKKVSPLKALEGESR